LRRSGLCLLLALASCGDLDGVALFVDIQEQQPTSEGLGILIRVTTRGGKSVSISIDGGSIVPADAPQDGGPEPCLITRDGSPIALAVRPSKEEALLSIVLFSEVACTGDVLGRRQVPLQAADENDSSIDAGADIDADDEAAGEIDASDVDAAATPDAGEDAGAP
jgi:hypothetical protein